MKIGKILFTYLGVAVLTGGAASVHARGLTDWVINSTSAHNTLGDLRVAMLKPLRLLTLPTLPQVTPMAVLMSTLLTCKQLQSKLSVLTIVVPSEMPTVSGRQ